jgi:Na+-driven multidrug efflux pump
MGFALVMRQLRGILLVLVPAVVGIVCPSFIHLGDALFLAKVDPSLFAAAAVVLPLVMLTVQVASFSVGGTIAAAVSHASATTGANGVHAVIRCGVAIALVFWGGSLCCFLLFANGIGHLGIELVLPQRSFEYGVAYSGLAGMLWFSAVFNGALRGMRLFTKSMITSLATALFWLALASSVLVLRPDMLTGNTAVAPLVLLLPAGLTIPIQLYFLRGVIGVPSAPLPLLPPAFVSLLRRSMISVLPPFLASSSAAVVLYSFAHAPLQTGFRIAAFALRFEYALLMLLFGLGIVILTETSRLLAVQKVRDVNATIVAGCVVSSAIVTLVSLPFYVAAHSLFGSLGLATPDNAGFVSSFVSILLPSYYLYGAAIVLLFALQGAGKVNLGSLASVVRLATLIVCFSVIREINITSMKYAFVVPALAILLYAASMLFAWMQVMRRQALEHSRGRADLTVHQVPNTGGLQVASSQLRSE